jgi:hypothetical protein
VLPVSDLVKFRLYEPGMIRLELRPVVFAELNSDRRSNTFWREVKWLASNLTLLVQSNKFISQSCTMHRGA